MPNIDLTRFHATLTDTLVKSLHWPHFPWPPISGDASDTMPVGLSPEIQGRWQVARAFAMAERHRCERLPLEGLLQHAYERRVIHKFLLADESDPK